MGYYADIYVIKKTRSKHIALGFVNHFLPLRKESGRTGELLENEEESIKRRWSIERLLSYLEGHRYVEYAIYWRNTDEHNLNRHGMLFYTSDGCMILGISRDSFGLDNTKNELACLKEMQQYLKTTDGYITYECPPEESYELFMEKVKN